MTSEKKYLGEPCGGTSRVKQSATQSRKRPFDLDPANHIPAEAMGSSNLVGPDQELAQLVWKYFSQEISEILTEVHQSQHG
jgi:hypothetical protein